MDDQRRPSPTGSGPERRASRAAAWLAAGLAVAVVLAPIDSRAADARSSLRPGVANRSRAVGAQDATATDAHADAHAHGGHVVDALCVDRWLGLRGWLRAITVAGDPARSGCRAGGAGPHGPPRRPP